MPEPEKTDRPSALTRARRLVARPRRPVEPAVDDETPAAAATAGAGGEPAASARPVTSAGSDIEATGRPGDADVVVAEGAVAEPVVGGPAADVPTRPRPRPPARALGTVTLPAAGPAPERSPGGRGLAGSRRPSPAAAARQAAAGTATVTVEPPAGGEPARTSRAGRNLPAAIGVGLGLGAVIVASLFLYRPSFAVVVGIASLYALYELGHALQAARIRVSLFPLLVGGAAMLVAAWERGPDGLVVAALVTVVGVLVWRIADGAHAYTRDAVASIFAVLYVPLLAGFAVMLAHPHDGAGRVLVFVATVVCSDTGGYATGVLFGKHPLAPVVSKAKTWEGFTGSVLACSAAGILFFTLTFHEQWWKGLLYGLAIVVTATLGDLGESMIKRDLDIKDMGRLLPGHGGVMDRLDSLLPCAAVAYLLLTHLAPV